MFRSRVRPGGAPGTLARGRGDKDVPGRPLSPGARPDVQGSPGRGQLAERGRDPGGGRTRRNGGAKPARKGQTWNPPSRRAGPAGRRRAFPLVLPTLLALSGYSGYSAYRPTASAADNGGRSPGV